MTDVLITLNFSNIKKIIDVKMESVIKVVDINEFNSLNENLLVILISNLQCLFIYKEIDIENKSNLFYLSIEVFEKLSSKLSSFSDKYLRMMTLYYYEILYYINMLPNESITKEIKEFLIIFQEFTNLKVKTNQALKGYFVDKLIELVLLLDNKIVITYNKSYFL